MDQIHKTDWMSFADAEFFKIFAEEMDQAFFEAAFWGRPHNEAVMAAKDRVNERVKQLKSTIDGTVQEAREIIQGKPTG